MEFKKPLEYDLNEIMGWLCTIRDTSGVNYYGTTVRMGESFMEYETENGHVYEEITENILETFNNYSETVLSQNKLDGCTRYSTCVSDGIVHMITTRHVMQ